MSKLITVTAMTFERSDYGEMIQGLVINPEFIFTIEFVGHSQKEYRTKIEMIHPSGKKTLWVRELPNEILAKING